MLPSHAMDDQLMEFHGLVVRLADRMSRRHRDEYDDLAQEGMILVWKALRAGKTPTETQIENRMRNWLKFRGRQRREMPADYNKLLPMEELRAVNAQRVAVRELPGHGPDATE